MSDTKKKHPISKNHPQYDASRSKWRRCRDVIGGSDTVKAAGTAYLPMLGAHKTDSDGHSKYESYKARALFYGATKRTKIGLTGAATHKEPLFTTSSEEVLQLAKKIVRLLMEDIVAEQLEVGRLALVVNSRDGEDPTFAMWTTESVVNWRYDRVDSVNVLTLLVIEQELEKTTDSVFEVTTSVVRHSYWMDSGVCFFQSFEYKKETDDWIAVEDPIVLTSKSVVLDHIPAVIVGVTGVDLNRVEDPLLLDMADVNISHYQNSADLEHGRHWTALPTAWAAGFMAHDREGNEVELSVGGESAWITEQTGAACGYLEFSGAGLGHIAEGMRDKQAMMAVLGARLIEEAKASVESAETIRQRMLGDKSSLTYVADTASEALTWVLQEMLWWKTPTYERPEDSDIIELDTTFIDPSLSPADVTQLMSALQNEGISYSTFFWYLQKGRVIPPERTEEEERALIDAGRPGNGPTDPYQAAFPGV